MSGRAPSTVLASTDRRELRLLLDYARGRIGGERLRRILGRTPPATPRLLLEVVEATGDYVEMLRGEASRRSLCRSWGRSLSGPWCLGMVAYTWTRKGKHLRLPVPDQCPAMLGRELSEWAARVLETLARSKTRAVHLSSSIEILVEETARRTGVDPRALVLALLLLRCKSIPRPEDT